VIVSASYRTDIPAFYSAWFLRRLEAGYCLVRNPYGGADYRVSLARDDCDGFVFWTRNAAPFLPALAEVRRRGFPFLVQYTVTGYPREIEWAVADDRRAVELIRRLHGEYGPRAVVWRYDPVLETTLTPAGFHQRNFERLAAALEGCTEECVISFAQIYRKTRTNLDAAARLFHFSWLDPDEEAKRQLAAQLAGIAAAHGMRLSVCSQRSLLQPGIEDAACIDAERLSAIAGYRISARRKGNRPDCGCWASRDIGAYDTCPHGCVYCYAVRNRALARRLHRTHDPASEYLLP
jgi:hypothetical protein